MFNSTPTKKLVIVCDDKTKSYGNYLMALISAKDDKGDTIVGIKDGSVSAVIWNEKDFAANEPKLSSQEHILFFGDSKQAKSQRRGLNVKFDKYGMHYGWLGKRAVLFVDRTITDVEEYNEFYDFAVNYQRNLTRVLTEKNTTIKSVTPELPDNKKDVKNDIKNAAIIAAGIAFPPVAIAAIATKATEKVLSLTTDKPKILQQQYSCLTMMMYLDGLADFLEG